MAADILLYQATHVPVGEDQKQHLELTRDIAQKFNNDFKVDFFPIVEPLIFGPATRVMSLRDGRNKMSKSDASDYSRINMVDTADDIVLKIRKAKTDQHPLPETIEACDDRPEAANLMGIYAALANQTIEEVCSQFAGSAFSDFKKDLADLAIAKLAPIQTEMRRLMDDPAYVDSVLKAGNEKANDLAAPVLRDVQKIIGYLTP
jgi:tryptophanyl-tRNA synthetase